ncbi:UDP-glucuronosyltransferase 1-6 [Pseudolycoriella hygida]|uniref:UDP-glucuronosyltransferase 1-6 n=1 Tax=Pseudolycoriella hygida TaxID=35572 RepID=A0A9Q0N243_9DIPT|nr:UDP-glucuronosyltransferase 1-6 [Pseudolycoriella hygida]
MRVRIAEIFLVLLVGHYQCESANILVLEELLSPSHFLWLKKVTAGLVAAGHNVTVVTPGTDVSSENLHYIYMEKVYDMVYKPLDESGTDFFDFGLMNPFLQFLFLSDWVTNSCKGFVASDGWQVLKNYPDDFKFDLVIHDFPAGICMLSFLQKFNYPPLVFMTAYAEYNFIAYVTKTVLTPAYSPYATLAELKPTFLARLENFLLHTVDYFYYKFIIFPEMDRIVSSSFENLPPLMELAERTIITMFNYDAAIDGVRQLPPNVIGVGGLQIEKPKELTGVGFNTNLH